MTKLAVEELLAWAETASKRLQQAVAVGISEALSKNETVSVSVLLEIIKVAEVITK